MSSVFQSDRNERNPFSEFIKDIRLLGEPVPLTSESDQHICKWWYLGEITMNEARKYLGFSEIAGGNVYIEDLRR